MWETARDPRSVAGSCRAFRGAVGQSAAQGGNGPRSRAAERPLCNPPRRRDSDFRLGPKLVSPRAPVRGRIPPKTGQDRGTGAGWPPGGERFQGPGLVSSTGRRAEDGRGKTTPASKHEATAPAARLLRGQTSRPGPGARLIEVGRPSRPNAIAVSKGHRIGFRLEEHGYQADLIFRSPARSTTTRRRATACSPTSIGAGRANPGLRRKRHQKDGAHPFVGLPRGSGIRPA